MPQTIPCDRKLTKDAKFTDGETACNVINIVPRLLLPDVQLNVSQIILKDFWESEEVKTETFYIMAHKQTLVDNIPYFEAAFRDSSNWVETNGKEGDSHCISCGSPEILNYNMKVPFEPKLLADYLKESLHDDNLKLDKRNSGDYLTISAYLLDSKLYDKIEEFNFENSSIYNFVDLLGHAWKDATRGCALNDIIYRPV